MGSAFFDPQIESMPTDSLIIRPLGILRFYSGGTCSSNDERRSTQGDRMTLPRMTRRTLWLSSLSLAAIGTGALAATYARPDDTVRYGTAIGAVGALRMVLPSVEKKYGLKYDVKDFSDSTSRLLALSEGELDIANT